MRRDLKKKLFVVVIVILAELTVGCMREPETADRVLINGEIYTVDPELGRVEALAIAGEKIVAVGTSEQIQRWIGSDTQVMDLKGKFVLPGFNDVHTHAYMAGEELLNVALRGTRSIAEFQARIHERVRTLEPGEWVQGGGWDHSLLKEKRVPTRADLDAVSTEHPMMFFRIDGHSVVVNSLALELAGITRDTPDPKEGVIDRDSGGEPTGWLKQTALGLVQGLIPPPTMEQRKSAFLTVLAEAARLGVTSMQDDSIGEQNFEEIRWENFEALSELKQEGRLTARITEWLPFWAPLDQLEQMRREGGVTDPWLHTGALKGMVDGSGGSRTAAMFEDFSNDPGNRGKFLIEPDQLQIMVLERAAAGFQIALHAIGDRAIRRTLDSYEAVLAAGGKRDARHRIEHVQYIDPEDIDRLSELGVIASMQPVAVLAEIRWIPDLLGPERESNAYAVNSILKSGAVLALGTDVPAEGFDPLRSLYAVVTREFEEGGPAGGYQPQEKISIEEAILASTLTSAYAEFEEKRKGSLTPGKFADLVVLSRDVTQIPPAEILQTEVLLTMVGGRVVYEKE